MSLWASGTVHLRTKKKRENRRSGRRNCFCRNPATHFGLANGVVLVVGCEWHVSRWVKTGEF